ncbi:threonine/serine ThrE exporter family protein [Ilumatobacter nonamiensis]|uniref:threonine/serine ThrE exporter family protein n=1 Tax=Ilumatobacter nonamiensis TaxID=467093 RepID=UPI00130E543E|nr:threonine/serine exporter family protein [Ilumatobacter nonamiensis]
MALLALMVTCAGATVVPAPAASAAPDETAPTVPDSEGEPSDRVGDVEPTTSPSTTPDPNGSDDPVDSTTTVPATSPPETDVIDDGEGTSDVDGTVTIRPGSSPQVRTSTIPVTSIIFALVVLGAVGVLALPLARRQRNHPNLAGDDALLSDSKPQTRRPIEGGHTGHRADDGDIADSATIGFLIGLGELLIDAGDAVSHVEATLRTVARVNGLSEVGVLVMPTALVVSIPGNRNIGTEVSTAGRESLRLDQIDDVLRLVGEAERGEIGSLDGQRRVAGIRTSKSPYRPSLAVVGYACVTVGLALVLHATWSEVAIAAALGAVIGAFRLSTQRLGPSYQPFIPLIAATAVSITVFALARVIDDLVTFPLLVAPLITFLPGAVLTTGVLELTTGQMMSGATRLASGAMQLVLLALGIVSGGQLVGVPSGDLRGDFDGAAAAVAPWIGVAIFGVGVVWFNGARAQTRGWILLVLYIAFAGQVIGGLFFGSALSAFFGALAMTPVALLAARQPSGPTPLVMFLPGFWMLVPGSLGLEGVARLLGDDGASAAGTLVTTATSMVGIALGILLGLILTARDPEHPWVEVEPPR